MPGGRSLQRSAPAAVMSAAEDRKGNQPAAGRGLATVWVKLDTRRHGDVSVLHARLHRSVNPAAPDYAAAYDRLYDVVSPGLCIVGEATVHHVGPRIRGGRWLTDKGRISCNTSTRHRSLLACCARIKKAGCISWTRPLKF